MNDINQENKLIEELLRFDLEVFAQKIGAINKTNNSLDTELAVKLLNMAEKYSRNITNDSIKEKCLYICGLIWEHRQPEWKALPSFLIRVISRLGLMPTTKMIDLNYDKDTDTFSGLGNLMDELYVTKYFMENEVLVGNGHYLLLSNFQKNMWDAIDKHDRLGISAPTSSGKSFVLVSKIISMLIRGAKTIVYIVPTISLINQVTKDIRNAIRKFGLNNIGIHQTYVDNSVFYHKQNVFVLTQERVASALTNVKNAFNGLDILIVDEVQNLERVSHEDDERAHRLYDVILEITNDINPKKIIVSGPRIENLRKLVKEMFGETGEALSDEVPPVLNVTYSFTRFGNKVYLNQYTTINDSPINLLVENKDFIDLKLFGQQQYTENMIGFINKLITRLDIDGSGSIIFAPTPSQAPKIALSLASLSNMEETNNELTELAKYISDSVHENYSLVECIKKGIGYHHGKMPSHVRVIIEKAFSRLLLKTIICTTTLMQGVNLPAKNIIARNPNLYTQKRSNKENARLTGYEFANLRGRAGRLMKDFVGRAIILDELAFDEAQIDLFEYPQKEVIAGYGDRFENYREEIVNDLVSGQGPSNETYANDILCYIRQMIIKYDNDSLPRMRKTGVNISQEEFKKIREQLHHLKIPKHLCTKNWYWDPITLNEIYLKNNEGIFRKMPKTPFDENYINTLLSNISLLRDIAPYYYNRYLNIQEKWFNKRVYSLLINAQKWSKEIPLKEIISWGDTSDHRNIDNNIADINKEIMYSIPKLMQPLVQIQDEDNILLTYMEMGAYYPETRRMIEIGIPRETSIRLTGIMKKNNVNVIVGENVDDNLLFKFLKKYSNQLDYWEQVQIEDFID